MLELRVTMPDGSVWGVPALVVADPRARYYAEADTGSTSGEEFAEAYDALLHESFRDTYELMDWAHNNMNWSDVKDQARIVTPAPTDVDFQEGWLNGEMTVVTIDDE